MLIGSIGRFVDHSRRSAKRKGPATAGMLGAPVGDWWIVDATQATHTDHVLVEPGSVVLMAKIWMCIQMTVWIVDV